MSHRGVKATVLACCGVGAMLAAMADANAGGFAIREMSSEGQGSSYAGVAAGGDLSSMFWNPATMTQVPGIQAELSATGILPSATNSPSAGSALVPAGLGGTGNTADSALVPSGYFSWQFRPDMWLGVSVNSPFGLSVSLPNVWAGRDYGAGDSHLKTYNVTPSFAYRINDWISLGVGVQVQYADASLTKGISALFPLLFTTNVSGTGWGYGFTAGVTLTPTPATTIGLGYRSAINQKINGSLSVTGPFALPGTTAGSVNTSINLPDMVSLGIRHRIDPQWTLLGTVEWTNWSRIGTSNILQPSGLLATIGGAGVTLPFQFKDGWLLSAGAEYQWDNQLTLRGGIGFERSPITDQVRIPLLPDNDRIWLSMGSTYKISKDLSFDFAYSHVFVKSAPINISAASGNPWFNIADPVAYVGNVSAHIDIISLALKYRFDGGPSTPKKALYTK